MLSETKRREKILARINKTETCWLWTGKINSVKYGVVCINYKDKLAQRVMKQNKTYRAKGKWRR